MLFELENVSLIRHVELEVNFSILAKTLINIFDDFLLKLKPLDSLAIQYTNVVLPEISEENHHGQEPTE